MTKSELIEILARRQAHLKADDVDLAVKSLLEMMGGGKNRITEKRKSDYFLGMLREWKEE